MPRNRDEAPAVRVYTVCDESRYLIVRNVPALGCGEELQKLCGSYGEIEECKPMDAEECEPFTDVYWIKFVLVSNARFAKRKLDEYVFLGNQLQVSYAPHFESLADTKEKLEVRRKEVLGRINTGILQESNPQISNHTHNSVTITKSLQTQDQSWTDYSSQHLTPKQREFRDSSQAYHMEIPSRNRVSSNEDYFPSPSMNETVRVVREKLDKQVERVLKLDQLARKHEWTTEEEFDAPLGILDDGLSSDREKLSPTYVRRVEEYPQLYSDQCEELPQLYSGHFYLEAMISNLERV